MAARIGPPQLQMQRCKRCLITSQTRKSSALFGCTTGPAHHPRVHLTNTVDSHSQSDLVPLVQVQQKPFRFSGRRPVIVFLFLFHSLLHLTSFTSNTKKKKKRQCKNRNQLEKCHKAKKKPCHKVFLLCVEQGSGSHETTASASVCAELSSCFWVVVTARACSPSNDFSWSGLKHCRQKKRTDQEKTMS